MTAFALESSGAAARALGVCHTLTLDAAALPAGPDASSALSFSQGPTVEVTPAQRACVPLAAPPTITLTF
jgi:hypothetical protein